MHNVEPIFPEFYHIGCLKTGTTSLQEVIGKDPRINLILHKRFFNTNRYFLDTYNHCLDGKVNIESDENICLDYDCFSGLAVSLKRIKKHAPQAHIIYTIREQRGLLVSAYKHHVVKSGDPSRNLEAFIDSPRGVAYLKIADYHNVFNTINQFFEKDRIHFFLVEDLKADYLQFYKNMYRTLGLSAPGDLINIRKNVSPRDTYVKFCAYVQSNTLFYEKRALSKVEKKAQEFVKKAGRYIINRMEPTKPSGWGKGALFSSLEEEFRNSNQLLSQQYGIELEDKNYLL